MKATIILTILGLIFCLVATTIFFVEWLKAERKLAKHNESSIFKEIKK